MLNCDASPMPPQRYAIWRNIAAIGLEVVAPCENSREMRSENARSANRKKISKLMSTWVLGDYCGCKIMQIFAFFAVSGSGGTLHLTGEPNRPLAARALMAAVRTNGL